MARILIVTLEGGGNYPPEAALGCELHRRGHHVRVLGHESQRKVAEDAYLVFCGYRHSPTWTPHVELSTPKVLTMAYAMMTDSAVARDVEDEIAGEPTDLVIVDCMLFNAQDAAARTGVPYVVLFHSFFAAFDGAFRHGPFGIGSRLRGLGPKRLWEQADMRLVCSDRVLDPAARRRTDGSLTWTGAIHDAKAAAVGRTPPRVLVSLSTAGFPGQRRTYQNIFDAAAEMDAEFVVTTGPAIDPTGLRVPPNATVRRYIPHHELMRTCSAVVGHGGHATTFRALAHGLPILIMPMSAVTDQAIIGREVAKAGAGIRLRKTASPEQIRAALERLLTDDGYRTAAAELGARLRTVDGASAAADRVLTLVDH
ncbi:MULTISPECIES: glycosyltransferase [Rhodococcus]|uniref:glycosyltransferase n=1 Tax=Rhodococcus TaxID=1827 RepID=UPI001E369D65|nr:glycosyltransferase [Rhodococcus pyridinivorans]MCD2116660.1 glycosyltransferase [Rhodococcus pyridinivorans]MCZ4625397.1 glycosyltransferase [Rhodococcus pyridinivorans]MCZ4646607.1 glycosyltransferase [Rhodococcus pyridinivorans]MDJ0483219.1 glycosyltransferase [Rhodococcus pyridinivorans]MDV7252840.1 glycosyltransferase [Rhodococcus pyridinivorans]